MENQGLKWRDGEVLALIEEVYAQTGFTPSYNEICERLDMSKGSVIVDCFKRLESAGHLVYGPGRKTCIPAGWRELARPHASAIASQGYEDGFDAGVESEKQRVRDLTNARLERMRSKKKNKG